MGPAVRPGATSFLEYRATSASAAPSRRHAAGWGGPWIDTASGWAIPNSVARSARNRSASISRVIVRAPAVPVWRPSAPCLPHHDAVRGNVGGHVDLGAVCEKCRRGMACEATRATGRDSGVDSSGVTCGSTPGRENGALTIPPGHRRSRLAPRRQGRPRLPGWPHAWCSWARVGAGTGQPFHQPRSVASPPLA